MEDKGAVEPATRQGRPPINVTYEQVGWGYGLRISYDENSSAYDVAREIIKSTLEPYTELEQKEVLTNLRVVLFGGTVTKLRRPKDYDLLVLYDKASQPRADDSFSEHSKTILSRLFPKLGSPKENITYGLSVYDGQSGSNRTAPHPKFVEVWLMSKSNFLASLNETAEQIRNRAFFKLIDLPDAVSPGYLPLDGFIEPELQEEWREPAIALCLLLGREFNYPFSKKQLSHLGGPNKEISVFHRLVDPENLPNTPEGQKEADKRIEKYLLETYQSLKIPQKELEDFLSGRMNTQARTYFLNGVVNHYTAEVGGDIGASMRWIYGGLISKTNPEMGAVESGQLITGDNIIVNGTPLFNEDRSFLQT